MTGSSAEHQVWFVWHHSVTSGPEGGQSNHIFYFLWLGLAYPDLRVRRRTAIGGLLRSVRGIGTGDAAFDKRFVLKAAEPARALQVVHPAVRHAMLTGNMPLPSWEIRHGTLLHRNQKVPTHNEIQGYADNMARLAGMLLGRPA